MIDTIIIIVVIYISGVIISSGIAYLNRLSLYTSIIWPIILLIIIPKGIIIAFKEIPKIWKI